MLLTIISEEVDFKGVKLFEVNCSDMYILIKSYRNGMERSTNNKGIQISVALESSNTDPSHN